VIVLVTFCSFVLEITSLEFEPRSVSTLLEFFLTSVSLNMTKALTHAFQIFRLSKAIITL